LHSADCVLRSVDFADIEEMQSVGAWKEAGERLAAEARSLIAAGARYASYRASAEAPRLGTSKCPVRDSNPPHRIKSPGLYQMS
jgi:hypothetical protein